MPLLLEESLTADLPWALIVTVLLAGILGLGWLLLGQARSIDQRLTKLDRLEDLRAALTKLSEASGGLDLRRLEHVLIDLRDAQKRLEPRLLDLAEQARARPAAELAPPGAPGGASLVERAMNRLLALGYERISVVTGPEELAELSGPGGGEGEIRVEARRDGAVHKGRVLVRGGAVVDAELRSVHSMFP